MWGRPSTAGFDGMDSCYEDPPTSTWCPFVPEHNGNGATWSGAVSHKLCNGKTPYCYFTKVLLSCVLDASPDPLRYPPPVSPSVPAPVPTAGPPYYPGQTVYPPSPPIIVPTPQQPPPAKREKKTVSSTSATVQLPPTNDILALKY